MLPFLFILINFVFILVNEKVILLEQNAHFSKEVFVEQIGQQGRKGESVTTFQKNILFLIYVLGLLPLEKKKSTT